MGRVSFGYGYGYGSRRYGWGGLGKVGRSAERSPWDESEQYSSRVRLKE